MNVVQNIDRRHDMNDDSARSLTWRLLLAAIMVVALFGLMVAVGVAQEAAVAPLGIDREDIILSWTVQTQSITPNSQKVKVPNMIMWAWPTTQSVKWMIFWNIQVTWKAHCRQVMKYITAPA